MPRGTGIIKALPLQLRSRETIVYAILAQILFDWCATATGQTCSDVIQRLRYSTPGSTTSRGRFRKPRRQIYLTRQSHRIPGQGG